MQIASEMTRDSQGDKLAFSADDLKRHLLHLKLQPSIDSFETQLDVTQCLHRTSNGMKILSDCMQRDLRKLKETKVMRILKGIWRIANVDAEDGSAFIKEPCTAFVVEKPRAEAQRVPAMGGGS
jgi:hypothetical protein